MERTSSVALCVWAAAIALTGCESVAVTVFGVGATTGVNQAINGTIDRTFTLPAKEVRAASLAALKTMGMTVEPGSAEIGGGVRAHARGRDIQVDFEALSGSSTRMRVVVQSSDWLFFDAATGREIVAQTERELTRPAVRVEGAAPVPMQSQAVPEVRPVHLESPPTLLVPSR